MCISKTPMPCNLLGPTMVKFQPLYWEKTKILFYDKMCIPLCFSILEWFKRKYFFLNIVSLCRIAQNWWWYTLMKLIAWESRILIIYFPRRYCIYKIDVLWYQLMDYRVETPCISKHTHTHREMEKEKCTRCGWISIS